MKIKINNKDSNKEEMLTGSADVIKAEYSANVIKAESNLGKYLGITENGSSIEDALATAKDGLKRSLFLASQALEAHGYNFCEEANLWLESIIDTIESTNNRIEKYCDE